MRRAGTTIGPIKIGDKYNHAFTNALSMHPKSYITLLVSKYLYHLIPLIYISTLQNLGQMGPNYSASQYFMLPKILKQPSFAQEVLSANHQFGQTHPLWTDFHQSEIQQKWPSSWILLNRNHIYYMTGTMPTEFLFIQVNTFK